jgi:hypothetical protein
MTFPTIKHCLICEELRVETRGKSSILGFYGIVPDTTLVVNDPNLNAGKISFVIISGTDGFEAQKPSISFQIIESSGKPIIQTPASAFDLPAIPRGRKFQFAIQFENIKFPHQGVYTFKILAAGIAVYGNSFTVEKGASKDLLE